MIWCLMACPIIALAWGLFALKMSDLDEEAGNSRAKWSTTQRFLFWFAILLFCYFASACSIICNTSVCHCRRLHFIITYLARQYYDYCW